MKKIVGIIAAVAMAASVFAAEISGGVRLGGDLFNYDGTYEAAKALMLKNQNRNWEAPLTLSITSDRAGGTFKFWDNESNAFETGKWNIWFKPMDMLQVNLGAIDKAMNTESITWTNRLINYDSFGASLDINIDAFTATLSIVPGNGAYWFSDGKTELAADVEKAYIETFAVDPDNPTDAEKAAAKAAGIAAAKNLDTDATLSELNLYAAYSADFGTISFMFDAKDTFKDLAVGAGYKNTFDPITVFADFAFYSKKASKDDDPVNAIGFDADVAYAQDALSAQLYLQWKATNIKTIKKETMTLMAIAKVAYTLDKGTVWLKFNDGNLMAEKFAAVIEPGWTSSVGIMDYEISANFDVKEKVNISIPVNFKVSF